MKVRVIYDKNGDNEKILKNIAKIIVESRINRQKAKK